MQAEGVWIAFATLATMENEINPDSYTSMAKCPYCKEMRSVVCKRSKVETDAAIGVYAIQCDHAWTLSHEESKNLRQNVDFLR